MKEKLSEFIDSLLENKLDDIVFDKWKDKKRNHNYYALDIDTGIKINNSSNPLLTQFLHFAVCLESGLIVLCKDEYEEFRAYDENFAFDYYQILHDANNKKTLQNLQKIIDSSTFELKLSRVQNIKKLIG